MKPCITRAGVVYNRPRGERDAGFAPLCRDTSSKTSSSSSLFLGVSNSNTALFAQVHQQLQKVDSTTGVKMQGTPKLCGVR